MKDREPNKYPPQLIVDLIRMIGYVLSKTFWFIRYTGCENIPPASEGNFLIAANHQTYADPVWICLPMRRRIRYMAYDKAFEWPIVGPLIRFMGAFPVRMDAGGTLRAMKDALSSLNDGAVLTVFPEGAREFADGAVFPFKTGAVRIARQAGVPILPVTVRGGNRIWPRDQKYPRLFRRVEIIYHPLFRLNHSTGSNRNEELEQWTDELREIICSTE